MRSMAARTGAIGGSPRSWLWKAGACPAASSIRLRSRSGTSRRSARWSTIDALGRERPVSTNDRCRAETSASSASSSCESRRRCRQSRNSDPTWTCVAPTRTRSPRLAARMRDKESVTPLELFFDLVFVLALTQCTQLMADEPTWNGLAKAMLVLAVLWWSWSGYAWLTSLVDPEEGVVRIAMFGAMAAFLVAALCVPEAFDDSALLFAIAYAVVRTAHIVLYALGSRDDRDLRASVI